MVQVLVMQFQSEVFMHDNAPFHVSKLTHELFEHKKFKGEKIMELPTSSPDLNPTKNLWLIVKMKLYKNGKQYGSKARLMGSN